MIYYRYTVEKCGEKLVQIEQMQQIPAPTNEGGLQKFLNDWDYAFHMMSVVPLGHYLVHSLSGARLRTGARCRNAGKRTRTSVSATRVRVHPQLQVAPRVDRRPHRRAAPRAR